MQTETNKIILFEYDVPVDLYTMLNYEAGIWFWTITPGVVTVTDDNGGTGYYDWQNTILYNIKSFRYNEIYLSKVTSLNDLRLTVNSFYYDTATTYLYIRLEDFEPVLTNNLILGVAVGYSFKANDNNFYNDRYYEPRISQIFNLKKSIDPLFYGLLKYQSGNINFRNEDGEFDNWRERNLFQMAARVLIGDYGNTYENFTNLYTGYIENDRRTWDRFVLTIQDPRKGLSQGVATNLLSQDDYPFLDDDNVDTSKPVAYGTILNASTYCLNETESTSNYTFLFLDTEFNAAGSIQEIRVDGVVKTPVSTNLLAGTFVLSTGDVAGNFGEVKIDFTVNISNGVNILKDLMFRYNNLPFLESFYDITEFDEAEALSRDTSIYIDESSIKLADAIESVANDCDIRFFIKDNGLYTARIYDPGRTPVTRIYSDDWIGDAKIVNNGSEYLTSVRIGYNHDLEEDTRIYYENVDYKESTFEIYKQYKTDTFDTELTTLADATDKSETIMNISKEISDIIDRSVNWYYSFIEPTDFIVGEPAKRISDTTENLGLYEVLSVDKNLDDFTVDLSLRFVSAYVDPIDTDFDGLVDEDLNYFIDEDNANWVSAGDILFRDAFVDENDDNFVDTENNFWIDEV